MKCAACWEVSSTIHVSMPVDREYFISRQIQSHINRCLGCGSLYQVPWPSVGETNTFYHQNYQNYTKASAPLVGRLFEYMHLRAAQAFSLEYGKDSVVLDFGCNQGMFLHFLHKVGYRNLFGFDVVAPSDHHEGVFSFFGSLNELKNSGQKFDVIRLNHVIEHLSLLDETMSLLGALLSEKGCIIGQTPNGAHYTSFLMKSYWGPLHFPYHVVLFSKEGLKKAGGRWNLTLKDFTATIQPTGWAMTFENILKPWFWPKRQGRSPVYAFLLLLSLPFVAFDQIFSGIFGTAISNFTLKPHSKN